MSPIWDINLTKLNIFSFESQENVINDCAKTEKLRKKLTKKFK